MDANVALVPGGSGQLGRVLTRALLEAGWRVAVPLYKTDPPELTADLQQRFGPERLRTFGFDLTKERGAEGAVRETLEWAGRLDAVVHLVGGYRAGRLTETPVELWDAMLDLNLKSAYLVARFALPHLPRPGGRLVFISSVAALTPGQRHPHAAYAVAKAALRTLADIVREDPQADGLRVVVLAPDTIDTEANRLAMPEADPSRWLDPDDIARLVLCLLGPDGAVVDGAVLPLRRPTAPAAGQTGMNLA